VEQSPSLSSSASQEISPILCRPKLPYRPATYSHLSPLQAIYIYSVHSHLSPSQAIYIQSTATCPRRKRYIFSPQLLVPIASHIYSVHSCLSPSQAIYIQSTAACPHRKPYVFSPQPPILFRSDLFCYFSISPKVSKRSLFLPVSTPNFICIYFSPCVLNTPRILK
jgi:hypothetical protein